MARGERAPDQTQITISLSKELLREINEVVAQSKPKLSRSAWVAWALEEKAREAQKTRDRGNFALPERSTPRALYAEDLDDPSPSSIAPSRLDVEPAPPAAAAKKHRKP